MSDKNKATQTNTDTVEQVSQGTPLPSGVAGQPQSQGEAEAVVGAEAAVQESKIQTLEQLVQKQQSQLLDAQAMINALNVNLKTMGQNLFEAELRTQRVVMGLPVQ